MTVNIKEGIYYPEVGRRELAIPNRFSLANRRMRWMLYALFGLMVADGLFTRFLVGLRNTPPRCISLLNGK